jgi:DICT domain-containing protein
VNPRFRAFLASALAHALRWVVLTKVHGGTVVVVAIPGEEALSRSWHLGTADQARAAAALAREEADALERHADTLDEIDRITRGT